MKMEEIWVLGNFFMQFWHFWGNLLHLHTSTYIHTHTLTHMHEHKSTNRQNHIFSYHITYCIIQYNIHIAQNLSVWFSSVFCQSCYTNCLDQFPFHAGLSFDMVISLVVSPASLSYSLYYADLYTDNITVNLLILTTLHYQK